MFVNQHMIKICFKEEDLNGDQKDVASRQKGGNKNHIVSQKLGSKFKQKKDGDAGSHGDDVISLKYTIDYPRVELHPFDTRKFQLFYADTKINASYNINRCLEMCAANRQARDIIALLIRCFSAQTYFINSKIIANVTEEESLNDDDESSNMGPRIYSVSDVLCELEQVKRELYNQIELNRNLERDKLNLTSQVAQVEEEMQITIQSYRSVLEAA